MQVPSGAWCPLYCSVCAMLMARMHAARKAGKATATLRALRDAINAGRLHSYARRNKIALPVGFRLPAGAPPQEPDVRRGRSGDARTLACARGSEPSLAREARQGSEASRGASSSRGDPQSARESPNGHAPIDERVTGPQGAHADAPERRPGGAAAREADATLAAMLESRLHSSPPRERIGDGNPRPADTLPDPVSRDPSRSQACAAPAAAPLSRTAQARAAAECDLMPQFLQGLSGSHDIARDAHLSGGDAAEGPMPKPATLPDGLAATPAGTAATRAACAAEAARAPAREAAPRSAEREQRARRCGGAHGLPSAAVAVERTARTPAAHDAHTDPTAAHFMPRPRGTQV